MENYWQMTFVEAGRAGRSDQSGAVNDPGNRHGRADKAQAAAQHAMQHSMGQKNTATLILSFLGSTVLPRFSAFLK